MNYEGFQGATFGVMDAVITVLGVIIGLSIITDKQFIVLAGVFTAGIADAFANAAGIHVAQETETHHDEREVFKSTIFCFLATVGTTVFLSFPIILFALTPGRYISIGLGLFLLLGLGYAVSKINKQFNPYKLALEYFIIGVSVIAICFVIGAVINSL